MPHKNATERNAYHRAYYQDHKDVINGRLVAINRQRRHERYGEIRKLKEGSPCADCGRSFPYYVMEYDHQDPGLKTLDVSEMVKRMFSWETVLSEIKKCDLLCVCCHRKRTYRGDNNYRTLRHRHHMVVLTALKSTTPCFDCGRSFLACQMDFDHLGTKVSDVARLVPGSQDVLLEEIRKCHLVCANCHRIRTFTGIRKESAEHSGMIAEKFREIASSTPYPVDQRHVEFPWASLAGTMPDKKIAENFGVSRAMVAWVRRKRGIAPFKRIAA